jgi:hypothetical protein
MEEEEKVGAMVGVMPKMPKIKVTDKSKSTGGL